MKRTTAAAGLFALSLAACSDPVQSPTETPSAATPSFLAAASSQSTGKYIVRLSEGGAATFAQDVASLGGTVEWASTGAGLATVSGLDAAGAAGLAAQGSVASVNADFAFSISPPTMESVIDASTDAVESPAAPQTAFFFPRQWNMRAVAANLAWTAGHLGSPGTSVFILDSGIDPTHADLVGRVDFSRSVDMLGTFTVNNIPFTESDTVKKYFPLAQPWTDLFYHGTHVAATASSNAIAAAGVASGTRLVAVKVCAYLNICPFSSTLGAVVYAADNGADVMNLSLGSTFSKEGNEAYVELINSTFDYARSQGVTIVVSAGNSAIDLDRDRNGYKTYCSTPSTICISATGPTAQAGVNGPWTNIDALASYSNYGKSAINIAAPGGNAASFVYAACSRTSLLVPVCGTGTFVVGLQGTSMASPHVTGAASLLIPILGRNPADIKNRLQGSADDLGKPGVDAAYGRGRLNVARAVGAIP